MGVISCRSCEASLIPNCVRVEQNVTAVALEQNPGDGIRMSPGWEKSLIAVQKKQDDPICVVGSRAARSPALLVFCVEAFTASMETFMEAMEAFTKASMEDMEASTKALRRSFSF